MNKPILITICGASGSGKTTFSDNLKNYLKHKNYNVALLNQDNFYNDINFIPKTDKNQPNFDHPNAFNWKNIKTNINHLLNLIPIKIYKYDYATNCHSKEAIEIENPDIIIFEGLYALFDDEINKLSDIKIFIQTNLDNCLLRRIERDVNTRGRDIKSIINQWRKTVNPMFKKFLQPTINNADLIIPWNNINNLSVEVVADWIQSKISKIK